MPNRVYESRTTVVTETGWKVRTWWTTQSFEACFDGAIHTAITEAVRANCANAEAIRAALEGLDDAINLAAFEIVDRFDNGAVVYPDWS